MVELASSVSLVVRPSYDAACEIVPPIYVDAWEWFLREAARGAVWRSLPHNTRETSDQYQYRPQGFSVSRLSGIYWPGASYLKNYHGKLFALSVHNSPNSVYSDVPPLNVGDGTWVLKYSAQTGNGADPRDQDYNKKLINNMEYGVPVGVFFNDGHGYRVMGLAFVERYDAYNRWFILHGPVQKGGPDERFCPDWSFEKGKPVDLEVSGKADPEDDEQVRYALQRQRVGQQRFREQLFEAYDGCCAVSDCAVDTVLEVAHIESYSGRLSQTVDNGILLRCDFHALFDAHLITFGLERGEYRMQESYLLGKSDYADFDKAALRMPADERFRPNERFLAAHEVEFRRQEVRRHEGKVLPYGVA